MESDAILWTAAASAVICGPLTAWVAVQKRRPAAEGAILGLLLGVLGLLVELLLPGGDGAGGAAGTLPDPDPGAVAWVAEHYRKAMDDGAPGWRGRMRPEDVRRRLRPVAERCRAELEMRPTEYSDIDAAARRLIRGE